MFEFAQLLEDLQISNISQPFREHLTVHARQLEQLRHADMYPAEHAAPIGCQLELTHSCNLRCLHCYNCSGPRRPELSIRQWTEIARQLADMNIFECVISGGEPLLLGDGLHKIMRILDDAGVRFIFITNGMLVHSAAFEKLSRYEYFWFQVSIDGASAEIHDGIRRQKGSWRKAIEAAARVDEWGLPLVISHVIVRQNIDSLDQAFDIFYALGARRVITGKFIYSGYAIKNRQFIALTAEQLAALKQRLTAASERWKRKMHIAITADPPIYLRTRVLEPSSVLLIRPNGDIRLDCMLPFKIGNISDGPLLQIWQKIGKCAWRKKQITSWIARLRHDHDMLSNHPRSYVDADVLVS